MSSKSLSLKVELIGKVLDRYYPDPPIPLNHVNDFTFLVAVVLSAQTTDGKVNQVTKELFSLADSPEKMSVLPVAEVQRIIQPVGLAPKKAQYVVGIAKALVEKFDSKVPGSYEELESLPGVGHKTASVIMSQLHKVPSFAVDTHVHRLALRWGLSKHQDVNKVQTDLCAAFPVEVWDKRHLQMIYFGREYCPAKNHKPSDCPVCSWVNSSLAKRSADELMASVSDTSAVYSPSKRVKNLVYYEDRVAELRTSPGLVMSPTKPIEVKVEDKEALKGEKLEF
eukprot:gene36095-43768_t